eukprot:7387535-Prymnesium_polylepis.1
MADSFGDDMDGDDVFAHITDLFATTGQGLHDDDFVEGSPESLMRTRVAVPTIQSGQVNHTLPAATSAAPNPPVVVRNVPQSGVASHVAKFTMMPPVVPSLIGSSSGPLQQQSFTSISGSDESGKVKCPNCLQGIGRCLGGATRGVEYAYICTNSDCEQRWNQER